MAQDVLNTLSSYDESPKFTRANTYQTLTYIYNLEREEQKLYNAVGCSNYYDFITKLRTLFSQQNMDVLKQFAPEVLGPKIAAMASQNNSLLGQDVKFVFDFSKATSDLKINQNIGNILVNSYSNNSAFVVTSTSSKKGDIGFNFNAGLAKSILNKVFKDRTFDTANLNLKATEAAIQLLEAKGVLTVQVLDQSTGQWVLNSSINIPNFPWGVTKDYIEMVEKTNNSTAKAALNRAVQTIKNFIFSLASKGTPELIHAVEEAWYRLIEKDDPLLFFQGTRYSNFLNSVQGALGEFQTSVIFIFLEHNFSNSGIETQILGNAFGMFQKGEQPKTDVQLFGSLGIQVKNVKTIIDSSGNTQLENSLKTNIHPSKVAQYLGSQADDFLDFIANYYFNISFAATASSTFASMEEMLKSYIGAVLNLSIEHGIKDTVSFYMIGAQYLVPGSVILRAAVVLGQDNYLEITSSFKSRTDLGYNELTYLRRNRTGQTRSSWSPEWTKYWSGKKTLEPTQKNISTYNSLITKDISIRSNLDFLRDIQRYALIV